MRPCHRGACVPVYESERMQRRTCTTANTCRRIHRDPHHRHSLDVLRGRQGWRLRERLLWTDHVRAPPSAPCVGDIRAHDRAKIRMRGPTSSGREAAGSAAGACRPSNVSASSSDRDTHARSTRMRMHVSRHVHRARLRAHRLLSNRSRHERGPHSIQRSRPTAPSSGQPAHMSMLTHIGQRLCFH